MIQDKDTNFVYLSDKLNWKRYRGFYGELKKVLEELHIEYGEIPCTKDIWARDFMPVQLKEDVFLKYQYKPDYLVDIQRRKNYVTKCTDVCNAMGITDKCVETDIIIDGGNVVLCCDKVVMTKKVFKENGKDRDKGDAAFIEELETAFGHKVIIIPWQRHPIDAALDEEDADVYGHADGFIKYCGGNRILMSNHRQTDEVEASQMKQVLEEGGFHVTEMSFSANNELSWAYINFLQVGNKIILPMFKIPEENEKADKEKANNVKDIKEKDNKITAEELSADNEKARNYVQAAFPDCEIRQIYCNDLAKEGGALHCITWNIKK